MWCAHGCGIRSTGITQGREAAMINEAGMTKESLTTL
jgi:hypothetical protein